MSVLRWSFIAVLASANRGIGNVNGPGRHREPRRAHRRRGLRDTTDSRATPSVSKANQCWAGPASACCATMRTSPRGLTPTANYSKRVAQLKKVDDRYELLTSKRRNNVYRANRRVLELQAASGARIDIEFQVSNDGFAFRYVFPETDANTHKISRELSSFNFLAGTRGWLQPIAPARSGWNESNPSYEEYYERDIPVGQPSLQGGAWVFPALFRSRRHLAAGERNRPAPQLLWIATAGRAPQPRILHRFSGTARDQQRRRGNARIHAAVDHAVASRGHRQSENHRRVHARHGSRRSARERLQDHGVGSRQGVVELAVARRRQHRS